MRVCRMWYACVYAGCVSRLDVVDTHASKCRSIIEIPTIVDPSATKNYPSATKNYPSATKNYPSATKNYPSATGSRIVGISVCSVCMHVCNISLFEQLCLHMQLTHPYV
jgi:hypothetical protein